MCKSTFWLDLCQKSPDTTCSDPLVRMETKNKFENRFLPTSPQINFRKSHKNWGQNEPFKSYFKNPTVAAPTPVEIGLNFSDSSIYS